MSDLISRQEAIDALNVGAEFLRRVLDEVDIVGVERAKYEWGLGLIESYIFDMEELPSAPPERKAGHWERHNTYYGDDVSGSIDPDWRCSECGGQANVNAWFMYDLTDFCPHCGADMRGEGDGRDI